MNPERVSSQGAKLPTKSSDLMVYFSFKKIGTLAILPTIIVAIITSKVYAAPNVRVQKQSQRAQVQRRSRAIKQQFTTETHEHCYDKQISVKSSLSYLVNSAAAKLVAKEKGIEKWEQDGLFICNVTPSWKFAKDKTINYEQTTGYPGGVATTGWRAIVTATPCQPYIPGHNVP